LCGFLFLGTFSTYFRQTNSVRLSTNTISRLRPRDAVLFVALIAATSCDSPVGPAKRPPSDLSGPWIVAAPQSVDIDPAQLSQAYASARTMSGMRSLLVVRRGKLVGEEYFNGNRVDSINHLRSVTKSVTALLVGIAVRRGLIRSTAQTLPDVIPLTIAEIPDDKRQITVKHLLTMTAGFQWNEVQNVTEYNNWVLAPDQIRYVLDRAMSDAPGQRFNYNSAAVHLLSVVLTEAGGKSTRAFAQEHLFTPLGITDLTWETDKRGYNNGGAGLALRPRDLAKIGSLILQEGYSGSTELVPSDWIREMTTAKSREVWRYGDIGLLDYGDLIWLGKAGGYDAYVCEGYGGQVVLIVPGLDLVVVATTTWQYIGSAASSQATAVINLIMDGVIPAVK
jgi:CubicO group peptidase (beta-lactamase class C family)